MKTIKLIDPSIYLAKRDEDIIPTLHVVNPNNIQNNFKNYQRTLDFNFKDSESNFMNFLYLTEKAEGIYDKGREPWIQKLACRCNKFGMSEATCLELTKKHLENHPNSLKKEDPINIKTHILNPIKDSYKRYAKEFNTWKIESSVNKKFVNVGTMRTAKQRILDAHNQPDIKKLFDVFWQTGELAILFGDTGLGKSILAVMIADSISKGQSILGLKNENEKLPVLFYDFELSDKQFEMRYSVNGVIHSFSDFFRIDNLDLNELCLKNPDFQLDELIYEKIKSDISFHKPKVVVIDNITFLKTEGQQKGDVAKDIMMKLTALKKEFDLSILVLAHTPKKPQSDQLNLNHLAGSKHISNFADSVFALGQSSKDPKLKYLKQAKPSRSSELIYDSSNVLLCEIEKIDKMLTFSLRGFDQELKLLSSKQEAKEDLQKQIVELKNKGKSYREIANELNISKSQAERELKKSSNLI